MKHAETNGDLDFRSYIQNLSSISMNELTVKIGLKTIREHLQQLAEKLVAGGMQNRGLITDALRARMAVIGVEGIEAPQTEAETEQETA
ncbi:MAG: hypothetical protein PHS73_03605 [Candidatus Peribacteraceae bacterium]|nr:hypothetical protein [Candidatus Peribacteraceae bacterium]